MISCSLRKCHLLLSLIYKKFIGKDVGFTVTLIVTLTIWLNVLTVLLFLASAQGLDISGISVKGSYLFGVIAALWGSALLINILLGNRWTYINKSRKYLRYLGDKRKIYISLVVAWLLLTYVVLFPFSLYFYGIYLSLK